MTEWDFVLAPAAVDVKFSVKPLLIFGNSLQLLNLVEMHSGLSDWVTHTALGLTLEQRMEHRLACYALDVMPDHHQSIPDYLNWMENYPDPLAFREQMFAWFKEYEGFSSFEDIFSSEERFLSMLLSSLSHKTDPGSEEEEREFWSFAYALLQDPVRVVPRAARHLRWMYTHFFEPEWKRVQIQIEQSATAYSQMHYEGMTALEVIEAVTGRNMRGNDKIESIMVKAHTLHFIPSPHLGPYIGFFTPRDGEAVLLFGARLPRGTKAISTDLNRSDLLVRLVALSDDTRLKILEMLVEQEEICAQDFINMLDLSQSSASRHLRQLTASGYLSERRRDVAKCYSLNRDRIEDTIQSLSRFFGMKS